MRSHLISLMLISMLVLCWASVALAKSPTFQALPYIYQLRMGGCAYEPVERSQTGFRVKGQVGIITALHGIADCTVINAVPDGGEPGFRNLEIRQVDIERDMALLSSTELDVAPKEGLEAAAGQQALYEGALIVGYPLSLDEQKPTTKVAVIGTTKLDSLIPVQYESDAFITRHSPDLAISVLSVEAHLLPGHSGAPLLDQGGRLIGVGNGGLEKGTVEIGWAIPWSDVQWQSIAEADVAAKLNKLRKLDPGLALSFSSTYPSLPLPGQGIGFLGRVANLDGDPVESAEVTLIFQSSYHIDYTDSAGFYRFSLDTNMINGQGTLIVKKTGYPRTERDVYLDKEKRQIDEIRLDASLPLSTPTPISCEYSFLVLDENDATGIAKAKIIVFIGNNPDVGYTDDDGIYTAKLPCSNGNPKLKVQVTAAGYRSVSKTIVLTDEYEPIYLTRNAETPTPTYTPTETRIPTPTSTLTPTPTPIGCIGKSPGNIESFQVYPNYSPSGKMGDIDDVQIMRGADVVRFEYETKGQDPHEWDWKYIDSITNTLSAQFSGVAYLSPPNNWGDQAAFNLQGFHVIKWEARSLNADVNVEFIIGGVDWVWNAQRQKTTPRCPDSLRRQSLGIQTLTSEWQSFEVDLTHIPEEEFTNVIGAFIWVIDWGSNAIEPNEDQTAPKQPKTFEIEIRNIRYER